MCSLNWEKFKTAVKEVLKYGFSETSLSMFLFVFISWFVSFGVSIYVYLFDAITEEVRFETENIY